MPRHVETGAFIAHGVSPSLLTARRIGRSVSPVRFVATSPRRCVQHAQRCPIHATAAAHRATVATVASLVAAALLHTPAVAPHVFHAYAATANVKFPPIDRTDARRCEPTSSAIGQANAARDKLLDLRECDLRARDMSGYDLSGGLFSDANLEDAKLKDAQLSKSYAPNANFSNVDFTNAVVDRVTFDHANLANAIFQNAVLSDSTFDGANLENVDFTDVYIGDFAQRNICRNPTVKGENPVTGAPTRESLGCR